MNKKGQVLVIFIIFIPIIILIFTLIVDIGNMYIQKRNISNNLKYAVEYSNKNNTNIEEILNKNLDKIKIEYNDEEIQITKKYNGIFIKKDIIVKTKG